MSQRSLFRLNTETVRSFREMGRRRRGPRAMALEALEARQLLAVTANPDIYVALQATPLVVAAPGVLGNDATTTGTGLTVANFTQPTQGTLTLNSDGSFRYTPAAGATGADQFTYSVADARGGTSTGTVQFAVSATTDQASVFAGPRLASVSSTQGALLNSVLGGLVGTNLNLTAADYNGLAGGTINGGRLADALGAELGVTPDQALTTNATLGQIATAAATVAQADGNTAEVTALQDLAASVAGQTGTIQLGDLIQASPNDGSLANTDLNALDLVTGSVQLFNFNNVVKAPSPVAVSVASLGLPGIVGGVTISPQVVEPPVLTTGPAGTQFHTAAIRARIDLNLVDTLDTSALTSALSALGFAATASLGQLSVYTEVAQGQGTIASVDAIARAVTLQATPGLANVYLGDIDNSLFFDRTHVVDPTTDVGFGTVGTLSVTNALLPAANTSTGIQLRSVAIGAAPTASTEVFTAPFPQSQTVSTSATFLTNLANSLATNLNVRLEGALGPVLDPVVNTTILPILTPLVTDAVSPVLAPVLGNVADPALRLLGTGIGELDLTVNAVNRLAAPGANADFATTQLNQPVVVPVLANDAVLAGEPVTVSAVTQPTNGTAALNPDGTVTYTPTAGYLGPDTFAYTITDPNGLTATGTVTVNVLPPPPLANPDTYTTTENTALVVPGITGVLANDTDPVGNPLTAVIDANPTNGTVTLNPDGSFVYTPIAGTSGTDTFTYRATDGTVFSDPVVVTLNVQPTLPVANPDTYTAIAGTPLMVPATSGVLANDTDPNGLPLAAVVATPPTHGTLTLNADGSLIYTPTAGYLGFDSFTYQASDDNGVSSPAMVSINVQPAGLPAATPDGYTLTAGMTLTVPVATGVLGNDTDPNGLPLSAVVATQPGNGSLILNADGSLTYTPDAGFTGTDSFSYRATDASGSSVPTTVTLTVNAAPGGGETTPQPPAVVTTFPVTGTVGVPIDDAPVVTFTDGDGSTPPGSYTATIDWGDGTAPSIGMVTVANGVYQVTGDHTYDQPATFPVGVTITRSGSSGLAAATIAVIAPAASNASLAGTVFADSNGDGVREDGEAGVAGAIIILAGSSTTGQLIYYVTTTALDGSYSFSGLPAGTYAIAERTPGGTLTALATATVAGQATAGTLGGMASNRLVTAITVPAGAVGTGYNFAEEAGSSLTGTVYLDANRNGTDDGNEYGVANLVVTLAGTTATGQPVTMTTTTDMLGHYEFAGLATGTYQVRVARPASLFNRGMATPGTAGGIARGDTIAAIPFTAGASATGYNFGELARPNCRLNTPAVRVLLRVGPNGSLPATFRPLTPPVAGAIARYFPGLAARANGQAGVTAQQTRTRTRLLRAAALHAAQVDVQHGKPRPNAAARRHK